MFDLKDYLPELWQVTALWFGGVFTFLGVVAYSMWKSKK